MPGAGTDPDPTAGVHGVPGDASAGHTDTDDGLESIPLRTCPYCHGTFPVDETTCIYCAAPVFRACAECVSTPAWADGLCPICGSSPAQRARFAERARETHVGPRGPTGWRAMPVGMRILLVYKLVLIVLIGFAFSALLIVPFLSPAAIFLLGIALVLLMAFAWGIWTRAGWTHGALILLYVVASLFGLLALLGVFPSTEARGTTLFRVILALAIVAYLFSKRPREWFRTEAGPSAQSEDPPEATGAPDAPTQA